MRTSAPGGHRRPWTAVCLALGCLIGALTILVVLSDGYLEIPTLPEPAGWTAWERRPGALPYVLLYDRGTCVGHGIQCARANVVLVDPRGWLRRGVSLDASYQRAGIYALDPTLYASGKLRVVSAGAPLGAREDLIVAFEDGATSSRLRFRHTSSGFAFGCTLLAGVVLLGGAFAARPRRPAARPARASPYREPSGAPETPRTRSLRGVALATSLLVAIALLALGLTWLGSIFGSGEMFTRRSPAPSARVSQAS